MNGGDPDASRNRDLDTVEEVQEFVTRFYRHVAQDDLLHLHFETIAHVDWHAHTLKLTDYWTGVVLDEEHEDADTVIGKHSWLHNRSPIEPEMFDRWYELFTDTIDAGWEGPVAQRTKKRGRGIAWAMAHRFLGDGAWSPAEVS